MERLVGLRAAACNRKGHGQQEKYCKFNYGKTCVLSSYWVWHMDTFGPLQVLDLKAIQPTPQHRQKFGTVCSPKIIPNLKVYHGLSSSSPIEIAKLVCFCTRFWGRHRSCMARKWSSTPFRCLTCIESESPRLAGQICKSSGLFTCRYRPNHLRQQKIC